MAKSLRSNKVQKNKAIKRQTTFGEVAEARERRIAERLHNAAYEKILESQHKPGDTAGESAARDETAMEVEAPAAEAKPQLMGLGRNLNKKRREERKAKAKRGSKKKNRK